MTPRQLVFIAVRLAGVLIGLHALVTAGQLIAGHRSIEWHPWSWWIFGLVFGWALAAIFLVVSPAGASRRLAGKHPSANWDQRTVEGIGLRLLGLYVLVQAAAETAHIGLYQIAFRMYLREVG